MIEKKITHFSWGRLIILMFHFFIYLLWFPIKKKIIFDNLFVFTLETAFLFPSQDAFATRRILEDVPDFRFVLIPFCSLHKCRNNFRVCFINHAIGCASSKTTTTTTITTATADRTKTYTNAWKWRRTTSRMKEKRRRTKRKQQKS